MKLRSGKMYGDISVYIDFDKSSYEWRKNKIYLGMGGFRYNKSS